MGRELDLDKLHDGCAHLLRSETLEAVAKVLQIYSSKIELLKLYLGRRKTMRRR